MPCRCPHCRAGADVRTSRSISPTFRQTEYSCSDARCGHTFMVFAQAVRTLSPSGRPDPGVYLPIGRETRDAIANHLTMTEPDGRELPTRRPGADGRKASPPAER